MSSIDVRIHFRFPFAQTCQYLRDGFAAISETGSHRLRLTARVPATAMVLTKDVEIECRPDPADPDVWNIRWAPERGGIYPSFEGNVTASEDERHETILELRGSYEPPLHTAGNVFDHVIGHTLAEGTAHDVLANIAASMKARYAYDEACRAYGRTPERATEFL